jgi:hypothetical protein
MTPRHPSAAHAASVRRRYCTRPSVDSPRPRTALPANPGPLHSRGRSVRPSSRRASAPMAEASAARPQCPQTHEPLGPCAQRASATTQASSRAASPTKHMPSCAPAASRKAHRTQRSGQQGPSTPTAARNRTQPQAPQGAPRGETHNGDGRAQQNPAGNKRRAPARAVRGLAERRLPRLPAPSPIGRQAPRRQRGRPVSGRGTRAHARIAVRLPTLPGSTGFHKGRTDAGPDRRRAHYSLSSQAGISFLATEALATWGASSSTRRRRAALVPARSHPDRVPKPLSRPGTSGSARPRPVCP